MTIATYRDQVRPKPQPSAPDAISKEGGLAYVQALWARLRRFCVLGSDAGTYYTSAEKLTGDNVAVVTECLNADPERTVAVAVDVGGSNIAPKHDPVLTVLALAARHDYGSMEANKRQRRNAYEGALADCRTFTHVSHFIQLRNAQISGRGQRRFVAEWLNRQTAKGLALQAVKYPSRDGWSMRDALILAHPKPRTPEHDAIYKWIMTGELAEWQTGTPLQLLYSRDVLHKEGDRPVSEVARIIRDTRMPREAVPTQYLNERDVWAALAADMPYTALIRNLNKMTAVGLFDGGRTSSTVQWVTQQITDAEKIRGSRVHPLTILIAAKQYAQGHGDRGSLSWSPDRRIEAALDDAFYLAFKNVPHTGKRIRLAVDVSGSMMASVGVGGLSAREVAAAVALVTRDVEPNAEVIGFCDHLVKPLPIRPGQRLADLVATMKQQRAGWTHCVLPIKDALLGREHFDAFVSYTDGETSDAKGNVAKTLFEYRDKVNPFARHAVVAMTANGLSLNDPNDLLALDVAGFDASVPALIGEFVAGVI
jgi:60 kDa SS-A/Ro ribonucleoprotein